MAGRATIIILLAALSACSSKPSASLTNHERGDKLTNPAEGTEMPEKTCRDAVDAFVQKNFESWTGWPDRCGLDELAAVISLEPETHTVILGGDKQTTTVRVAAVDGLAEPLYVWHRDGAIAKLGTRYPAIKNVASLLKSLGRPALELDTHFSSIPTVNHGAEWVYPDRGLTLFMSSDKTNVVEVAVYPVTTAAAYQADLYFFEPPRESE